MEKNLTITVISKACGISAPTLRIWEKRYKAFSPGRDDSGQRLYSEEDLLRAKMIAALLERGHSTSNVVNLSSQELRQQLESGKEEFSDLISKKEEMSKLVNYLNCFDIEGLATELQFQRAHLGAKGFIFKIVLPVMKEVGDMVYRGKCSVTQEHIVSSIIRDQLSKILVPVTGGSAEKFALATPEGNMHELPIIIADILCRINRVHTNYLGAAHPAECLGEAVSALKCKTVIMGVMSSDQWNYEKNIISYLSQLDKSLKLSVRVIIGGGWIIDFPKFKNISEVVVMSSFEDFDQYLSQML